MQIKLQFDIICFRYIFLPLHPVLPKQSDVESAEDGFEFK